MIQKILSKDRLILMILLVLIISCTRTPQMSKGNAFSSIRYDKVIAYEYIGDHDIEIIDKRGQLAEKIKRSTVLSRLQVIEIANLLTKRATYGNEIAMCFNPRLGIVFYEREEVTAYISICLECNYLISSFKISPRVAFSKKGNREIAAFQKRIGLWTDEPPLPQSDDE